MQLKILNFCVWILAPLSLSSNLFTDVSFGLRCINELNPNYKLVNSCLYIILIYISDFTLLLILLSVCERKLTRKDANYRKKWKSVYIILFSIINIILRAIWSIEFYKTFNGLKFTGDNIGLKIYGIIALSTFLGVFLHACARFLIVKVILAIYKLKS